MNNNFVEARFKGRNEDGNFQNKTKKKRTNAFKLENENISMRYRLSYFAAELELNSQNEIDVNCFKLRATRLEWFQLELEWFVERVRKSQSDRFRGWSTKVG